MIRANAEQSKYVPWFAKAGAACSIVPIARFVTDHVFALKGGGYGCLFSLSGVDEEGLTDQELDSQLRMIEGALRGLPEGACLYQYARVMSGFELPRNAQYENPVTQVFVDERLRFLESSAGFRRIDLHWCLTLEPSKAKSFERKPQENGAATSRMLAELQKAATLLAGNLANSIGLRLLDKQGIFPFFSYLFNLEDWAEQSELRGDTGVDRQITENGFEIVAGARRYRAAQMAEQNTVPVPIVHLSDAAALEAQLAANLIRSEIRPIEEAEGFRALLDLDEPKYTIEQIAAKGQITRLRGIEVEIVRSRFCRCGSVLRR
jgi:hypothetical protein